MFSKDAIVNTKLVILTLDGGLLDLNRLRYNYFKRLCTKQNHTITLNDFESNLGCYKTMYDHFTKDYESINNIIEKDLYSYANLKSNIKKDGIIELLQFLKQKKIKIAVISSHKTSQAIGYLQMAGIYDFIDFIVGGDTDFDIFPSVELLEDICSQMQIKKEHTIIVSNYPSLLQCANDCFMDSIYVNDLCDIDTKLYSAVGFVSSYLEVINIMLFSKYDDVEMYSKVLGLSSEMDLETLNSTHKQLLHEYQNDDQLLVIVNRTYDYYLNEINTLKVKTNPHTELTNRRLMAFEDFGTIDEPKEEIEFKENTIDSMLPPSFSVDAKNLSALVDEINKEPEVDNSALLYPKQNNFVSDNSLNSTETISVVPEIEKKEEVVVPSGGIEWTAMNLNETIKQPISMEQLEQQVAIQNNLESQKKNKSKFNLFKKDKSNQMIENQHDNTSLDFDFIRKDKEIVDEKATSLSTVEPKNTKIKENKKVKSIKEVPVANNEEKVSIIGAVIYSLLISLTTVVLSMFGYMCLKDFLQKPSFISNLISNLVGIYLMAGEFLLSIILDTLNSIVAFIPSYDVLMQGNEYLSGLAILMIWFTFIGAGMTALLKKGFVKLVNQAKLEYSVK